MAEKPGLTKRGALILLAILIPIFIWFMSAMSSSPRYTPARSATYSEDRWTDGKWPFVVKRVTVSCEQNYYPLLKLVDRKFSLNGMTNTRFGYPFPYENGLVRESDDPGLKKITPRPKVWMSVDKFRQLAMGLCRS